MNVFSRIVSPLIKIVIVSQLTMMAQVTLGQKVDTVHPRDSIIIVDSLDSSTLSYKSYSDSLISEKIVVPNVQINNNIPGDDWLVAIIPILTLLLGFVLNRAYERWMSKEKVKTSGKGWVENLILLKDPISSQIKLLEEFNIDNPEDRFTTTDLKFESDIECEAFKALNQEHLIPFLQLRNKQTSYRDVVVLSGRINRIIKTSSHTAKGITRTFEDLKKNFGEHMVKYNEEFQLFMEKFRVYGVQLEKDLGGDPIQYPSYRAMLDLVTNHIVPIMETGEADLFELVDLFFMPFAQATVNERHNPLVIEMSNHLSNCMQQIKGMKHEKKVVHELTDKYIKSLQKIEESLDKVLKELDIDNNK